MKEDMTIAEIITFHRLRNRSMLEIAKILENKFIKPPNGRGRWDPKRVRSYAMTHGVKI